MRIRLKERCFFLGRIYEPGEEAILPDGIRGPHRAIHITEDTIDFGDPDNYSNRRIGLVKDVPLFDVIDEKMQPEHERHGNDAREAADEAAEQSKPQPAVQSIDYDAPDIRHEPPGEVRTTTHIEDRS